MPLFSASMDIPLGTIDANSLTTLTGTAAELNTAYTSNGTSGLNNEDAYLSDTTLGASSLTPSMAHL